MEDSHSQSEQDFAELYDELEEKHLEVLQKIARGLAGKEEAEYVAGTWGLTTQFRREKA